MAQHAAAAVLSTVLQQLIIFIAVDRATRCRAVSDIWRLDWSSKFISSHAAVSVTSALLSTLSLYVVGGSRLVTVNGVSRHFTADKRLARAGVAYISGAGRRAAPSPADTVLQNQPTVQASLNSYTIWNQLIVKTQTDGSEAVKP